MTENNSTTVVKQPSFRISNVTVSIEIADKEFGNGNSGHTSISGYVDDAGLAQIESVIDAGLSLYIAAWETVLGGKVATKLLAMSAQELQNTVAAVQRRAAKVRALLHDGNIDYEKKEDKA
jgi:hypothetical protein